jgi:hypothetical protein
MGKALQNNQISNEALEDIFHNIRQLNLENSELLNAMLSEIPY